MKSIFIFLLIFLFSFFSCKKENSNNDSESMYNILKLEFKQDSVYLKKSISVKINKISDDKLLDSIKNIESLVNNYLMFLDFNEKIFNKNINNPFFNNNKINNNGKKYLIKSRDFCNKLFNFTNDSVLKNRIQKLLGVSDVNYYNKNIYVKHIDFYYLNLSKKSNLCYINNRKRDVLLIFNELINEKLFDENLK